MDWRDGQMGDCVAHILVLKHRRALQYTYAEGQCTGVEAECEEKVDRRQRALSHTMVIWVLGSEVHPRSLACVA